MTSNNGLDVLIAWSIFLALLILLATTVLRRLRDPISEAKRRLPSFSGDDSDGRRSG